MSNRNCNSTRGIVAVLERDEEPPGGFERNPTRRRPPPDERPGKNKTPRPKGKEVTERVGEEVEENITILLEKTRPQAPAGVLSVVSAENPPEKKEEKKMESNVTPVKDKKIPFPVIGFEICPICGQYSKHAVQNGKPYLVCKGCDDKYHAYVKECDEKYRIYADQVAVEIAADKNPIVLPKVVQLKPEWILARLDITSIEKELVDARFMMEIHNKRYPRRNERISERVRAKANGKKLTQEVLVSLQNLYEKEVTEEDSKTAKGDITLVRYLNTWLTAVKKLKPELEKMIAERATPEMTTAVLVVPEPANV